MKMFQSRQNNGDNLFVRILNVSADTRALWYAEGHDDSASYTFTHLLGVCIFQPHESCPYARVLVLLRGANEEVVDVSLGRLDPVQAEQLASYIRNMS
jgi:hypothetical protein